MKNTLIDIIAFGIVFPGCVMGSDTEKNSSDWDIFSSFNRGDGHFICFASGSSKEEAIIKGLEEFACNMKALTSPYINEYSDSTSVLNTKTNIGKVSVNEKYGNIQINSLSTLYITQSNSNDIQSFEKAISFQFNDSIRNKNLKRKNMDAVAVIIGNRDYEMQDVIPVDYADRDAFVMKEYLMKTLGYQEGNIICEKNAGKGMMEAIFGNERDYKGKLFGMAKPGKSEVFVYYSGHGAPDPTTKQGYLVPVTLTRTVWHSTASRSRPSTTTCRKSNQLRSPSSSTPVSAAIRPRVRS